MFRLRREEEWTQCSVVCSLQSEVPGGDCGGELCSTTAPRSVTSRVIGWVCLPNSVTPHVVHHSHHHTQRWVAGAATSSAYPGTRWAFPSVSRVYAGASLR